MSVYMPPSEKKLQAFLDIKTLQSKTEVQRIAAMAAQLMLEFPGIQRLTSQNHSFVWTPKLQDKLEKMKEQVSRTSSSRLSIPGSIHRG